ncbi:hypothetical protein [Micrococcus luteus]|uniref:hypothetical protein n=1 Tax=Micrococcus luteus TaxID=1270 RepID=UPI002302B70D|nr:hypothetical protein [Micrococcus luteus]
MKTTTISAISNLLDFAGHFYPLDADSVICIGLTRRAELGPCARVSLAGNMSDYQIAAAMNGSLRQASVSHALTIFTGALAAPTRARRITQLLRRHVDVLTPVRLDGRGWHELDTEVRGSYTPGTSNVGLALATAHGARTAEPSTPVSAQHSTLAEATRQILTDSRAASSSQVLAAARRGRSTLSQIWPRLLAGPVSDPDAATALLALGTPLTLTHTTALAVLYPPTAGPAASLGQIHDGMPQGVEWTTADATDALLTQLINRGPDYAAIGPLSALAYGAWLRGRGARAAALTQAATTLARAHHHIPLAAQITALTAITHDRLAACALNPRDGYRG